MLRIRPSLGTTLVCGAAVCLAASALAAQQVFRGRVDLVRVDVSVIDNRTGKPVTDLKAEDFTVTENGTRQRIEAFAFHGDEATTESAQASSSALARHSRRVFMIVFGAALDDRSFDGPYGLFDGTVRFIRERLKPGDLISVMAFNRFTELTTDHEAAFRLVQRLKTGHREEYYQRRVAEPAFGVRADLSAVRQASIDRLMAPPGDRLKLRSTTDLILNSRAFVQSSTWRPWNDIVMRSNSLMVHAAVEYLRRVEGNKQVVFFGYTLPVAVRWVRRLGTVTDPAEEARFAAWASDAGVALNIINVSGVNYAYSQRMRSASLSGISDIETMQLVAEMSGGQYTGVRTADQQYQRIDDATRSSYAIGYSSTNPKLDGTLRTIKVTVDRPGLTVVFRHRYTAKADVSPADLREILTSQRLRQAAATDLDAVDIPLEVEAVEVDGSAGREIRVTIRIDGSRLDLQKQGERWVGDLDLVVIAGDRNDNLTGTLQQRMTLGMDETRFTQATTTGIPYNLALPVSARSTTVKVLVYEYASDKMGSVAVRVKGGR